MKSVSRLFRDWIFSNSLIVIFLLLAGSMLVLTPEEQKFCGHCVTFAFLAVPALIFILQDFLISEENVKEHDNLFATKFVSLLRTGEYLICGKRLSVNTVPTIRCDMYLQDFC